MVEVVSIKVCRALAVSPERAGSIGLGQKWLGWGRRES